MKRILLGIIIGFCFFQTSGFSQTDVSSSNINKPKQERYFRLNYDNDFFSGTDYYYTQGICIELIIPLVKKSPVSKLMIPLNKNAINYYGIALEQDGFTPLSIRHDIAYIGERPYASVFFVTHSLVSINTEKKQRLTTKLDIGIIGPAAMGEQEQKGIHRVLNNIQPLGWEYQISQDVVLNYGIQFEKGIIDEKYFEFTTFTNAQVGSLYDDAGVGAIFRGGLMQNYFQHLYINANFTGKHNRKFQCYFFAKGEIKAIGYNTTMQGGVFDKNSIYTIPSKDITRVIAIGYAGIVFNYNHFSLEYTKAYLTAEFKNGLNHGWGHCVIMYSF